MYKPAFHLPGPQGAEALRLALLQGLFWAAWAVGGYQTIYLQENGFPASRFGMLNAIACVMATLAVTFWSRVSDRTGSLRRVTVLTIVLGSGLYAMLPLIPTGRSWSVLLFLAAIPAINFFRAPVSSFVENLTVRNCAEHRLNYGAVRSMGSLLYSVAGILAAQLLIPHLGVAATFPISGLLVIPVIFLTLSSPEPQSAGSSKKARTGTGELLKNRSFAMLLVFGVFFYTAVSFEGSFLPYLMREAGADTGNFGIILASRAIMEIPCLLLIAKLRRRFPPRVLIVLAVLFMAGECLFLGTLAGSLPSFVVICMLFGIGNGMFFGTAFNYIYDLAPIPLRATAHGLFVSVQQIAGIFGNLIGGVLFDRVGGRVFYIIAAVLMLFSAALFFFSSRQRSSAS